MVAEGAREPLRGATADRAEHVVTVGWERVSLVGVLILSAVLEFWRIGSSGYPNTYYAAGVRSMTESWHAFFFNSFDPAGFVTIDKPPLGFWLQVASVKIFGFHPWSVLLPEALAGIAAVYLLYSLVARQFGPPAGLLAALALAVAPINVVTDRTNVVDGILVFTVLVAAWALMRAVERGSLGWLLLSALIVGLGFNVKMLEAYLVVPALGLTYLLGSPRCLPVRLLHLVAAGVVLFLVSASWITAVDATPASQRPYVGSTTTNSEWDLAVGYNGLQRLNGRSGGGFGGGARARAAAPSQATLRGFTQGENGAPGPLRLFNQQIGVQVSWLLPLALLGLIVALFAERPRFRYFPLTPRASMLLLWGMWGLTQAVFFSKAQFFHVYYMVMMTPALAALFGIGIVALWRAYVAGGIAALLLPFGLALTAIVQIAMVRNTPNPYSGLSPAIAVLAGLACVLLLIVRIAARPDWRVRVALVIAGALSLLVGPTVWTSHAVASNEGNTGLPSAGASRGFGAGRFGRDFFGEGRGFGGGAVFGEGRDFPGGAGFGGGRGFGGGFPGRSFAGGAAGDAVDSGLIRYLDAHVGHTRYYVAGLQSTTVAPIIIATGKPAIALGGFSGADPVVTPAKLSAMVRGGEIRYFLLPGARVGSSSSRGLGSLPPQVRERIRGGGFFGRGEGSALTTWVQSHCEAVPSSAYSSTGSSAGSGFGGFGRGFGGQTLYDCGTPTTF